MDNFMRTSIQGDKLFVRSLVGLSAAAVMFVIFALQTSVIWFLYLFCMEIEKLGYRKRRYVELAKRMAQQSTYGSIKHGAVLVKGGSVLNASFNKDNHCGFGNRFREKNTGHATLHAELGCILNLDRSVTDGAEMYVVRVGWDGSFKMSRPCPMCRGALEYVGVRRVHFTTDKNTLETLKL